MKLIFCLLIVFSVIGCSEDIPVISLSQKGFSPNGDGINDLFIIAEIDTNFNNHIIISDPYSGENVLDTKQYHHNWWSGRKNNLGREVSSGTYSYTLYQTNNVIYKGEVYLAR